MGAIHSILRKESTLCGVAAQANGCKTQNMLRVFYKIASHLAAADLPIDSQNCLPLAHERTT